MIDPAVATWSLGLHYSPDCTASRIVLHTWLNCVANAAHTTLESRVGICRKVNVQLQYTHSNHSNPGRTILSSQQVSRVPRVPPLLDHSTTDDDNMKNFEFLNFRVSKRLERSFFQPVPHGALYWISHVCALSVLSNAVGTIYCNDLRYMHKFQTYYHTV